MCQLLRISPLQFRSSLLFIVLPTSLTHWSDPMVLLGWGPSQCSERHCSANVRCIRAKGIRWCDQRVLHVSGASLYFLLHHSMLTTSHRSNFSIALKDLCLFTYSTLPTLNHPYQYPCCRHADLLHFIHLFHSHPPHLLSSSLSYQASLPHIKPFKILAETIGSMQAQLSDSPIK